MGMQRPGAMMACSGFNRKQRSREDRDIITKWVSWVI